ncbi:oligosaccharide flippase family protein [Dictyobacter kobayashii]|uniref:Uncharacterized protein n=1 Tax=Dictyobacter kobayashii TaxID=2014872 RepID=A0A402APJ8_9CHLR|nr:lipopolysaccharide biosynthesis protein [Dictyobacter kobayashii]GCE21022.1 hypothetical protein KDK_48220 [Dictyobacter kobayashii]
MPMQQPEMPHKYEIDSGYPWSRSGGLPRRRAALLKDPTILFTDSPQTVSPSNAHNIAVAKDKPASVVSPLRSTDEEFAFDQQPTWLIPAVADLERLKHMFMPLETGAVRPFLLHTLLRHSGVYAIASCMAPFFSLLLTPFLTRHLTALDYGILTLLNTTLALLGPLAQLGLGAAFVRLYHQCTAWPRERHILFTTLLILLATFSLCMSTLLALLAPWLSQLLLHSAGYEDLFRQAALLLLLQNMTIPGFTWLRAQGRSLAFVALALLNLLVNLALTFLLVGSWQWGNSGVLVAACGGYASVFLCSLPLLGSCLYWRVSWSLAWQLLAYGLSTLPGLISVWVLQSSDRYFLLAFGALTQTASYSIAYTLGNILGPLVIAPFSLAWYSALHIIARKTRARELFALIFRWYCMLLLLMVFGVSLLGDDVLHAFFPPSYTLATPIIPLIALSNLFFGLFELFNLGITLRGKLRFNLILLPLAALVNLGCNGVLVPMYGAMGAAISTLLAYAVLALLAYLVNQRLYSVSFDLKLCCWGLLLGAIYYAFYRCLLPQQNQLLHWLFCSGMLACYAASLWLLNRISVKKAGQHEYVETYPRVSHAERTK